MYVARVYGNKVETVKRAEKAPEIGKETLAVLKVYANWDEGDAQITYDVSEELKKLMPNAEKILDEIAKQLLDLVMEGVAERNYKASEDLVKKFVERTLKNFGDMEYTAKIYSHGPVTELELRLS